MKTAIAFVVALLLAPFSYTCFADTNGQMVEQTVHAFMAENHIPGMAVLLYVDGKPATYTFGYANQEKKKAVTAKTIFEIGSLAKIMTSLLLAQEVDYAKVSFTDPVSQYLPHLSPAFNAMSLQSLATHTAGMPDNLPASVTSQAMLDHYLARFTPQQAANTVWGYSNVDASLLAMILETTTHQDINQLYHKRIFAPLKMQASGVQLSKKLMANIAQGYDAAGNPAASTTASLFKATFAMKMSVDDMRRFLSACVGAPGISERISYPMKMTQATFVRLNDGQQGLAWQIHPYTVADAADLLTENDSELNASKVEEVLHQPIYDGNALIDKTGATAGFRAYIAVIPNKKSGIAILSNRSIATDKIAMLGKIILLRADKLSADNSSEKINRGEGA